MWCSEGNPCKILAGFIQRVLLHLRATRRFKGCISLSSSFFSFAPTGLGPFLPIPQRASVKS